MPEDYYKSNVLYYEVEVRVNKEANVFIGGHKEHGWSLLTRTEYYRDRIWKVTTCAEIADDGHVPVLRIRVREPGFINFEEWIKPTHGELNTISVILQDDSQYAGT